MEEGRTKEHLVAVIMEDVHLGESHRSGNGGFWNEEEQEEREQHLVDDSEDEMEMTSRLLLPIGRSSNLVRVLSSKVRFISLVSQNLSIQFNMVSFFFFQFPF